MAQSIDALQIEISAKADSANRAINRLTKNLDKLSTSLNSLNVSNVGGLSTVANQTNAVASGSTKMNNALKKTNTTMKSTSKQAWSLARAFGKFYANYFLIIRGAKALWGSIESTADYIEAYNYYNVAFGKIASEWKQDFARFGYDNAEAYADSFVGRMNETLGKLSGVQISVGADGKGLLTDTGMKNLGLNIQEITQYASQLASVTNAVGQTGETSLAVARTMTMLAGDVSSLFNVDFSNVATNIQAVLQGQSRAGYKYGWDTTLATLQKYADELNLSKAVSEMTQLEKQQLRIIAVLDQSKVSWGDLANTINSPSNMIRQLTTNLKEAGMVLGQLFIPMLENVLPVVNGATIALKRLLTEIAGFFGVEIDFEKFGQGYNQLEDEVGDLSDSYDDLASSVKEAQNQFLSFDDANKLSDTSATLSVGTEDNTIDLTDEIVLATEEYQKVWDEAFANMENTSQKWAGRIQTALDGIGDIFEDFAIGDFFKAGEDTSQLVIDFNNFIANALKDVDWEGIGTSVGLFLKGIKWGEVFISLKDVIVSAWDGLWDAWFASFKESPFETLLLTSIGLMSVDSIRNALLTKLSGMTGLEIGKMTPLRIGAYATIAILGVEFAENLGDVIGREIIMADVPEYEIYFNLRAKHDEEISNISQDFADLNAEAQKYLDLSSRYDELSLEEKSYVKQMADDLSANVGGITTNIDSITGKWLGTNEELSKAIENQMYYIKLSASQEYLQGLYQELYRLQEQEIKLYGDYAAIGEGNLFGLLWTPGEFAEAISTEDAIEKTKGELDILVNLITQTENEIKYYEGQLTGAYDDAGKAAQQAARKEQERSAVLMYNEYRTEKLGMATDKATESMTDGMSDVSEATEQVYTQTVGVTNAIMNLDEEQQEALLNYMNNLEATNKKNKLKVDSSAVYKETELAVQGANRILKGITPKKLQIDSTSALANTNTTVSLINGKLATVAPIRPSMDSSGAINSATLLKGNLATTFGGIYATVKVQGDEASQNTFIAGLRKKFESIKLQISSEGGATTSPLAGALVGGFRIKAHAMGGFPDEGQLFIAREAGPELVGTMGGRTAVANNDQITQGIAQAVYSAFTSALSATNRGSSGDIIVNIDGKQVFKAVQKQANNYVAQTGQTPFPI